MVAVVPWFFAVGVAILIEAIDRRRISPVSLESALVSLSRTWSLVDGVFRIYAERRDDGSRIVVECSETPDGIPGEHDGFLVRIRVVGMSDFGMGAPESAARRFGAMSHLEGPGPAFHETISGRIDLLDLRSPDSAIVVLDGHGTVRQEVMADRISADFGVGLEERMLDGRSCFRFSIKTQ